MARWMVTMLLGVLGALNVAPQNVGILGRAVPITSGGGGGGGALLAQTDLSRLGYWTWTDQQGATGLDKGPNYSGLGACVDPNDGTMFFLNEIQPEISHIFIPSLVNSTNIASLNVPTFVQTDGSGNGWSRGFSGNQTPDNFAAPCSQFTGNSGCGGNIYMANCAVLADGRLAISMFTNYDPSGLQQITHYTHSRTNLFDTAASFAGYYTSTSGAANIWRPRYFANYMANVPSTWQTSLGGDLLIGLGQNYYTSTTSTLSQGPSLAAVTAATAWPSSATIAGGGATYTPTPLLYYPYDNSATWLGSWDNGTTAHPVWNGNTRLGGVALIPDHHTALFIGTTSIGYFCYGYGVTTGTPPNPLPTPGQGPNPPTDGNVSGSSFNGTDASTDATGTRITLPNRDLSAVNPSNANVIWLTAQTTPAFPRSGAVGLAYITGIGNSGTASAYVTVDASTAFTPNLTAQSYEIGDPNCYDPEGSAKGQHGYPYHYYAWAYDMNDLAAVKAGTKNPWDVQPYATWDLETLFGIPLTGATLGIHTGGAVTYDATAKRIYIVLKDQWGNHLPVTVVLKVA